MDRITRRNHLISLAALAAIGNVAGAAFAAEPKAYFGVWSGTLSAGSAKLRLKLIVASDAASLYSLDQGGSEIKASEVTLAADSLTLEFATISAQYVASLDGPDALKGTFTQGGHPLSLDFARGDLFAPPQPAKIEALTPQILAAARTSAKAPAIGAAWAKDGAEATIMVDGLRSSQAAIAVTSSDQWHLGSITKSITATLVARMVEAGGITWDTTIGDVLGGIMPDMNPAYRPVTLRHLCSHHGGLQANIDMAMLMAFPVDDSGDPRPDRVKYAGMALKQDPVAAPGTTMVYSNSGYIVAATILETVYKATWESLITAHVFVPLKLASAGFGPPGTSGKLDQPVGHVASPTDPAVSVPVGTGAITPDNPVVVGPAGRVHMNLHDLVTYLNAHLLKPAAFLKVESWTTLHTPPFTANYAMGWLVNSEGGLWHNGSNLRWYAEIAVVPLNKTVAAIATNDGNLPQIQPTVGGLIKSALLRAST